MSLTLPNTPFLLFFPASNNPELLQDKRPRTTHIGRSAMICGASSDPSATAAARSSLAPFAPLNPSGRLRARARSKRSSNTATSFSSKRVAPAQPRIPSKSLSPEEVEPALTSSSRNSRNSS
eukprot:2573905-Rhodomonas_salina.1